MSDYLRGYGWRRQAPDARDRRFTRIPGNLPPSVDLRPSMPPVYDQGQLGSCTANAIGAAMEYERTKQGEKDFVPSRLFIYYNERVIEGTVATDSGAQIRDGIKTVNAQGVCPEALWPYEITMFAHRPARRAYAAARADIALTYETTSTLGDLKGALAGELAVVFGFTVYQSFETQQVATTGIVPMPDTSTEKVVGGHAVLAVGYDDATAQVIVRNSWGSGWGEGGYFHMPYAYLTGTGAGNTDNTAPVDGAYLASDFWAVQQTS